MWVKPKTGRIEKLLCSVLWYTPKYGGNGCNLSWETEHNDASLRKQNYARSIRILNGIALGTDWWINRVNLVERGQLNV